MNLSKFDYISEKRPASYEEIHACGDVGYAKTWLTNVELLQDNEVKISSLDSCVDQTEFKATNNGYWVLKEIEPRVEVTKK